MARPPIRPKPARATKYLSVEECEDRDNEDAGYHRAEVKVWPPERSRAGEAVPSISTRCVHCGVNVILYGSNDPEVSNFKVTVLEAAPREVHGSKK